MELLELIKKRRSVRKYQDKQITEDELNKILEAGTYAPNAGGGQRRMVVAIHNKDLADKLGRLNVSKLDRTTLSGNYVSKEQPSIIDDSNIKSGFYGAPTVCIIFAQKNFLYSIPDSFCVAENMVLEATSLGISSCIVARAEDTFDNEEGKVYMKEWDVPENYIARCFVLLGYCEGEYPKGKERKEYSYRIIK